LKSFFVTLLTCSFPAISLASMITTTYTGQVDVSVSSFASAGSPGSGTLNVAGLPVGASIVNATLFTDNYFSNPTVNATFAGNSLGSGTAFANDGGTNLEEYSWDVTGLVTGNGSYSASYSGANNTYGLYLVVVYSDPSLPANRVQVMSGALDICGASSCSTTTQTFTGFGAGSGTLYIHTGADNTGQSGETINFNDFTVGGPIDANLGSFASLFVIPVSTLAGDNTININSQQGDQFDWDLAVLSGSGGPTTVPEPVTSLLVFSGLAAIVTARKYQPRRNHR